MKTFKPTIYRVFYVTITSLALVVNIPLSSFAQQRMSDDPDFLSSNNILFYDPTGSLMCNTGSSSSGSGGSRTSSTTPAGNVDYKGDQIIKDEHLEKIKGFQSAYEEASSQTGIPWQFLAVVHLRESVLADFNPDNGQGIYQNSLKEGGPYPHNDGAPVGEAEFLRQTVFAANRLKDMAGSSIDLVEKGDPEAIKDLFFTYNGRAYAYVLQAKQLLGEDAPGYEGSPYVMNIADEKRDPNVNKTSWGQIKRDYGPVEYPANSDHGAFIMYAAIADLPSVGTGSNVACSGRSSTGAAGANGWDVDSMVIYYQGDEPWASKRYGATAADTIAGCGCGPTSMAMAIATLNNDESINPETMSNFFMQNGYVMDSGCGTQFSSRFELESPFNRVANEYDVSIIDIGTDLTNAEDAVRRGSLVFMSFESGTPFGNDYGHIMLMRGVTDDGKYLFADPSRYADQYDNEVLTSEYLSNKTINENGYSSSDFTNGLNAMYEIRK